MADTSRLAPPQYLCMYVMAEGCRLWSAFTTRWARRGLARSEGSSAISALATDRTVSAFLRLACDSRILPPSPERLGLACVRRWNDSTCADPRHLISRTINGPCRVPLRARREATRLQRLTTPSVWRPHLNHLAFGAEVPASAEADASAKWPHGPIAPHSGLSGDGSDAFGYPRRLHNRTRAYGI